MEEGQTSAARNDNQSEDISKASNGERSFRKRWILAGLALIFFILLILGIFLWLRRGKGEEVVPEEQMATGSTEEILEEIRDETAEETEITVSPTPTKQPVPTLTPTATPTPELKSKSFSSSTDLDGFQSSNGGGNRTLDVRVGRNVNLVTRGFVSFGIGEIPTGATIQKVTLRMYQAKIIGDPYGVGARVMLDHLDYGMTFENADYSATSISSSFARLSENAGIGWKEIDVTDALRNDMQNGRERSQFRLHLAVENKGGNVTGDFAYFESADNSEGTGNTPQLAVTYY